MTANRGPGLDIIYESITLTLDQNVSKQTIIVIKFSTRNVDVIFFYTFHRFRARGNAPLSQG